MKYLFFTILLALQLTGFSQNNILVDGTFADWQNSNPVHTDPLGDAGISNIDFADLWIADNTDYLFLSFVCSGNVNLQENNELTLYLDTDNNPATGQVISGIGAELQYTFGRRNGTVKINGNTTTVFHNDIGLVTAPTISSDRFELVIRRDAQFFSQALFSGNTIKVLLKNNASGGDQLPDQPGGIAYTFSNQTPAPLPTYSFAKPNENLLRFLSYNTLQDGLFDFSQGPAMKQVIKAIAPDFIGFQETYDHSSAEAATQVESILPSAPGHQWYHSKQGPDIIAVSRYPITKSFAIEGISGSQGNGAFLIDLRPQYDTELLFIVAHTPCCTNDAGRQQEVDAIMAFIRSAREGNFSITLEAETPIIIVGDMNFVGDGQQLQTFLTGNISNENAYGPDFNPDWDGSDLEDALAYTTGLPMAVTWYNTFSSYSPGRLDFVLYTGSVMTAENSFALFTGALPADTLALYNLNAQDQSNASDHLPVVVDFRLDAGPVTATEELAAQGNAVVKVAPNPFSDVLQVSVEMERAGPLRLVLFDGVGRVCAEHDDFLTGGKSDILLAVDKLLCGVYFIRLEWEGKVVFSKVVKIE